MWNLPVLEENEESPAAVVGNSSLRQGASCHGRVYWSGEMDLERGR